MRRNSAAFALISGLATALFSAAGAQAACVPQGNVFLCGASEESIRTLPNTVSPDGRYAVGWQAVDENGKSLGAEEAQDPDDLPQRARDVLVRLSDGALIAALKGEYWEVGGRRANHMSEWVVWSDDSRQMIDISGGRYTSDAAVFYRLNGTGNIIAQVDLVAFLGKAAREAYRRETGKSVAADDQTIAIATKKGQRFKRDGILDLTIWLSPGKTGALATFDAKIRAVSQGQDLRLDVVSIRRSHL